MQSSTEKSLRTIRQLYAANKLDAKSIQVIISSNNNVFSNKYNIESCSDIIEWAEKTQTDESRAIHLLVLECLGFFIKEDPSF